MFYLNLSLSGAVEVAIFPSIVLVTRQSYPVDSLLSAYAYGTDDQTPMPWRFRSETEHRISLQRTRQGANYENLVTPGIEISLLGAWSCHVSKFGISSSVLSCACCQVTRLPV